jgi:hypothetical protein
MLINDIAVLLLQKREEKKAARKEKVEREIEFA